MSAHVGKNLLKHRVGSFGWKLILAPEASSVLVSQSLHKMDRINL